MIYWTEKVRQEIAAAAEAAYPEEACGLLLGRVNGNDKQLFRTIAVANVAAQPRQSRYAIDPRAYLAAETKAVESGWEVLGVFHSHPDAQARPSATDLREAWPGLIYIIVAVTSGRAAKIAAFELESEQFVEVPLSDSA